MLGWIWSTYETSMRYGATQWFCDFLVVSYYISYTYKFKKYVFGGADRNNETVFCEMYFCNTSDELKILEQLVFRILMSVLIILRFLWNCDE